MFKREKWTYVFGEQNYENSQEPFLEVHTFD